MGDAEDSTVPERTRAHISKLAPNGHESFASQWRDSVFIEYYFNANNSKCGGYNTEDIHNNFIGLRHLVGSEFGDTSYAEYQTGNQGQEDINFDGIDFVEYFNLTEDTWQMNNLWKRTDHQAAQKHLHDKLRTWFMCKGDSCP